MIYDKEFAMTSDNFYVYPTQNQLAKHGDWEPWLRKIILDFVNPGDICYDIGASSFYFSEIMARAAGPLGQVYAFEPIVDLVNLYKEAQKLNSYDNIAKINIFNLGLSNQTGQSEIFIPEIGWDGIENDTGGSTLDPSKLSFERENFVYRKENVYLEMLKNLEIDTRVPRFIKMDIEGCEYEAWQGFPEHSKLADIIAIEVSLGTELEFLEELMKNRVAYYQNNMNRLGNLSETIKFIQQEKHTNILLITE